MPLSVFEPRTMMGVLNLIKPKSSFLLDTFFGSTKTHDTRSIEVDIIKGRRRLAPFVSPMAQGVPVDRQGAVQHTITMPYLKPKIATEAAQLLTQRTPGQTVYQSSPAKRGRAILAKDLVTLRDMVDRREEAMAAEALSLGKVTVLGEGVDQVVDYLRPASHQVINTATANAWDAAGVDILTQLRGHARTIAQSSGTPANICVMGSSAADALIVYLEGKSTALSLAPLEVGQIKPDALGTGATYLGRLQGIDFYEYNEWAEDVNGVEQPLLAPNRVIFGSRKTDGMRHYGAIQDLKAGNNWAVPYFIKSWEEEDPSVRWLMAQSAPLPVLHRIESVISLAAL